MIAFKYILNVLVVVVLVLSVTYSHAQNVIWIEDFDDGGGARWVLEDSPGSQTNPTPAGITGLTYGTNAAVAHDNWVINDRNTPQLDADILTGTSISGQGQFVRGRHYACSAPSNLPNPFINQGAAGPNQSLHVTAYPTCATLLYGGTPQSDDWNCISDPDNGDVQTQTEQIAYLNTNIDASGSCSLVLTADFFIGGDSDGIKSHGTILYSTDGGTTWKILEDNLRDCSPFLAGTCNNWHRRSFAFPADADGQNDLRIALRWYDDGDIENTGDYALGASFNVDNIMISSCNPPTADFSVNATSGCKNQTFYFTDESVVDNSAYINCFSILSGMCDITAWSWDISRPGPPGGFTYVNGTSSTSQNPEVQFTANATYTVELTVTNCGGNGVVTYSNLITIADCPPTADFTTNMLSACAIPSAKQDTVTFTDLSTTPVAPITAWSWTFTPATVTYRNGTTSSSQNIDVTFDAVGTYQVALQVTNAEGNDTETKTAYIEAIDCNCGGGAPGPPAVFWTEDFEVAGGCNSGCDPSMVAWTTTNTGTNSGSANRWYVSCADNGNAAGSCGAGCGSDETLHMGSTTLGDIGAAYDAGQTTNKRAESPTIDCSSYTGITVDFNYIGYGEPGVDYASFQYYNGVSWSTLVSPITTAPCCGGACNGFRQGRWTAHSTISLPSSADNNANVKIGFNWTNNGSAGTDPSFAVDDITLTGTNGSAGSANTWEGDVSNNWNTAGNWSTGVAPTSATDVLVPASVCGACSMPQISSAAVANNVCNFGVITLINDNTLTIDSDLLNEGEITSTSVNAAADVIFANSASIYKGSGTLYDVDVGVTSSNLTLETNMHPRSLNISTTGTVDIDVYKLTLNRDLTKSNGTFTCINGTINLVNACAWCLDQTNTTDIGINANQQFGNVYVNKNTGIKASLVSNFNYIFNTPKTLTIQSGVVDANTFTLNGTGNLTMTGGELQLAKCATTLPELTGTYTLPGGKITFDGVCAQTVKPTATVGTDYYKVEFAGSGIKSLGGNTTVADSLVFSLPTTTGNYVNAGADTLFVTNTATGIVAHTGGHVVGNLSRDFTALGGSYTYYVGSNNSDGETYYESIVVTPNALTGPTSIVAEFIDAAPNPTTVVPNIIFGLAPTVDTIQDLETEGYWHLGTTGSVLGGNYTAAVSPDQNFWSFVNTWGGGQYTLLKQETIGDSWDYTAGGSRVNDSTTTNFSDFSNYALGYAKNNPLPPPLAIELLHYSGYCEDGTAYLSWATATETNSQSFIIERSDDGFGFVQLVELPNAGNSTVVQNYSYVDPNTSEGAYYRLSELDADGEITYHGVLHVDCSYDGSGFDFGIYPNPNDGTFSVNIFSAEAGPGQLVIRDLAGREVFTTGPFEVGKGINIRNYSIPELSRGVYIVSARFGNMVRTVKLTVAR